MVLHRYSFIVLLSLLFFSSCEQSDNPTVEESKISEQPRVLLVMKSLVNPFYIEIEKGALLAATEREVELVVKSGTNETLVEQQIEIIDEQLALGIDALVIAPADSIAIIPVLVRAFSKGVKIVNIDNKIDEGAAIKAGLPMIPFVSVDNEKGGYLAGKYLAELSSSSAKALIIEGPRSAMNARQRRDGAKRALLENKAIEIVMSDQANWKLEQAYAMLKKVHAQHPDLKIVFAANDMMALGAVLYAQENNMDDLLIGGYDNIPDAEAAVKNGWLKVTIDQQAYQQGYQGMITAVDMIQGISVESSVLVDVRVVNQ